MDYRDQKVRLASVAELDMGTGYFHIRDATFANCTLVGPAVLMPLNDVHMDGLSFSVPGGDQDLAVLVFADDAKVPVGYIIAERVRISDCRAHGVTIAGTRDSMPSEIGRIP